METPLDKAVELHKALGHPVRLRILAMLSKGELCVCQINAVIRLAPSTVSAHLLDLRRAGLLVERKDGRFVSYRQADEPEVQTVLAETLKRVARDPQLEADARLIRDLRRVPVEVLCRAGLDVKRCGPVKARPSVSRP